MSAAPVPPFSADPWVQTFVDADARGWEVRAIRDPLLPERRARFLNPAYVDGWLLFTSEGERRRLAPLPPEWREASEAQLRDWCVRATPVSSLAQRPA